jgi:hypothetical protein
MRRLALMLPVALLAAACGATVEDAAPPAPSSAGLVLARAAAAPSGGVRAADGSASFSVRGAELLRHDPATGRVTGTVELPGAWTLEAVSAQGRWVGLTRPGTEILVVDAEQGEIAHRLELDGSFAVETISVGGDFLFLQQDFPDGSYAVRGYNLARGRLLIGSLGRKGETVKMQGRAGQVVASPDGEWLLTLYVDTKAKTAFVHALNLFDKIPLCIVLPPCDDCALGGWRLVLRSDGRRLVATNAGRRALIDLRLGRVV